MKKSILFYVCILVSCSDKGIYKESKTIAYQDREDIRNNFLLLAKSMAKKASFCGYATHDQTHEKL